MAANTTLTSIQGSNLDQTFLKRPLTEESKRKRDNAEKWEELKRFFYSTDEYGFEYYFDRRRLAWPSLIVFYGFFYSILLAFFIVCLALYLVAIDEITPHMTHMDSPLKHNPGLTMRPVPDFESTLIRFVQGKPQTYKPYTDHIQSFLLQYENEAQVGENFVDCSQGRPPNSRDKVCRFDLDDLDGGCTWQRDYGYDEGQPCVVLKLNKVYDWEPEVMCDEDECDWSTSPEGVYIRKGYVYITCEGEYEADIENIGNITYSPAGGLPGFFWPYLNQEGFRSPLMTVKFNNPANGMLINVICKAWAHNIHHHRNDNAGLIKFQILVD